MHFKKLLFLIACFLFFLSACKDKKKHWVDTTALNNTSELNIGVTKNIKAYLSYATANQHRLLDSTVLAYEPVVDYFYDQLNYLPVWSDTGLFKPIAYQFKSYLDTCLSDGLLKSDYHHQVLVDCFDRVKNDSTSKKNDSLWAYVDVLLTDAFMHLIKDCKQGRLVPDSLSYSNDINRYDSFFVMHLESFMAKKNINALVHALEPKLSQYQLLKQLLPAFVDSMDTRNYTVIDQLISKDSITDSLKLVRQMASRLFEAGFENIDTTAAIDSLQLAKYILGYQLKNKLYADGKISIGLVNHLNLTDKEKFKRILVSLDKYKLLPDSIASHLIWVNIPAYKLTYTEADSILLVSKIICGKPATQTPTLMSAIHEIVTYPTWTVPMSIIKKEMLPGLKKSPAYLSKKGLKLYDQAGKNIDPATINWTKYNKGIPYKIRQDAGERNALGIIKFNFKNPFDVYLHDTNQRYFFNNSMRALSHGCVRVQEWQALAACIAKHDSTYAEPNDSIFYNIDSINNWIANKEKHRIPVKNKVELYIQYITCEAENNKIRFFNDVYDIDKKLTAQYFSHL